MNNSAFPVVYAKDYKPADFLIATATLQLDIFADKTLVTSKLNISRQNITNNLPALTLDGSDLELQYVKLNDARLTPKEFSYDTETLTIHSVPQHFTIETQVCIYPEKNTTLSGLYKTGNNLCTQCESTGFRRITFFIDRPDILTQFTTTIVADKNQYATLLSNGNLIASGDLENNRHFATWHDPSLKSSYLFAVVTGNFALLEDVYITHKNKNVTLRIYAEPNSIQRCLYAMTALKSVMQWEEDYSGSEYDLDTYMLVAIDDLNAAAMENKGLNVFSSDYILASPDIATDTDYQRISSVIAHEYLHNWTGNRITCRDWFQIGLKEGITTFREQQFSAEHFSPTLQRINQIRLIRSKQFAEDASPLAHPVRLKSYLEVANFYSITVYYKSAEIAQMLHTIVGADIFCQIMRTFFTRFDGKAVTIEDFIDTAADVAKIDLTQFKLWYDQKGTPELEIQSNYDAATAKLTLNIKQTSRFPEQQPFYIPLQIAAFTANGTPISLAPDNTNSILLTVKSHANEYSFTNVHSKPILSINCNFAAPIKINYAYSDTDLYCLMQHGSDPVNQWLATQEIISRLVLNLANDYQQQKPLSLPAKFVNAIQTLLSNHQQDAAFTAEMVRLPTENYLLENLPPTDIDTLFHALEFIKKELATTLKQYWLECYQHNHTNTAYSLTAFDIGKRDLKNIALHYLNYLKDPSITKLCLQQLDTANNLTDILGSLTTLANSEIFDCKNLLDEYYLKWQHEHTVINKWLALNATIKLPGTLHRINSLTQHPAFNIRNPSNTIALLRNFAEFNPVNFHQKDGAAYKFYTDQVLAIDTFNPQNAVSIAMPLTRLQKLDALRQQLLRDQLTRIIVHPGISRNLYEIISQSLSSI